MAQERIKPWVKLTTRQWSNVSKEKVDSGIKEYNYIVSKLLPGSSQVLAIILPTPATPQILLWRFTRVTHIFQR